MTVKKESIELVRKLSEARGISGFEDEVVAIVHDEMATLFNVDEDSMRNVYIKRKEHNGNKPVVLLDAHSDEVGFIIQAIKPNGTLVFLNVGGWIPANITAQKVLVRNRDGVYISGVVATKPPHFMSEAERAASVQLHDLVIDVGASSKEEVEQDYRITIGAPVVPDATFSYNESNELFFGKAFDCRIGVAALIETMKILQNESLQVDVVGTVSAQEEVGLRGAEVAVKKVQPDIAVVFEGAPADDTFNEPYMIQSALKKGPMLRHFDMSSITNPRFQAHTLEVAAQASIPVQPAVRSGGGTDAGAINLFNGAPAIVIAIPVRYAHTPHCYVASADYENAIKLAVKIVQSLNGQLIASF